MALNTLAPLGLIRANNLVGAPTYGLSSFKIKNGYTGSIGLGDLVRTGGAGVNQGEVILAANNDTSFLGVFAGIYPYYDTTLQAIGHGLMGSYRAGLSPPTGVDIQCAVIDDPFATYRAQVSGGPWSETWRGQNINWLANTNGAPNAAGLSTLVLDAASINVTPTLPLRIVGLAGVPGGPQDPANTNPWVLVRINASLAEHLMGTGI
jgi:hypothetical protein